MRTACYLINLSPSASLNGDVPDHIWYSKKVSYEHLKIFGYRVFVHVPKEERSKLDDKTKQCVFWDMQMRSLVTGCGILSTKR